MKTFDDKSVWNKSIHRRTKAMFTNIFSHIIGRKKFEISLYVVILPFC